MSDISLPYRPRAAEDPQAAAVVQSNLEYLVSLLQKGVNDGDVPQWDVVAQKYVSAPLPPGVIAGAMFMWPSSAIPTGYFLCNGQSLLRATYPDLFAALGGTGSPYGLSDSTHFELPDFRGRMPVGVGTHVDVDAYGENDGAALADRRPKHKHTVNDPTHRHPMAASAGGGGFGGGAGAGTLDTFGIGGAVATGVTVGPQTAGTPVDTPSYIAISVIIKY